MKQDFQNLKIAITDEVHLKAVCDVLESMGYKNEQFDFHIQNHRDIKQFQSVACYEHGVYCVHKLDVNWINFCELATLTDLLKMRDNQIKEAISAKYWNGC